MCVRERESRSKSVCEREWERDSKREIERAGGTRDARNHQSQQA